MIQFRFVIQFGLKFGLGGACKTLDTATSTVPKSGSGRRHSEAVAARSRAARARFTI